MMRTCYNGRASCNLRMFIVLLVEGVSLDSGFRFSTNFKLFIKPLSEETIQLEA